MRCGCPQCGAYMIQQDNGQFVGCRCPACDYRCDACMGTDSVLSRADIETFQSTGIGRLSQLMQQVEEDTDFEAQTREETDQTWTEGFPSD